MEIIYKYFDGSFYDGEFKDGEFNGYGILKLLSGLVYEGEFADHKFNGKGIEKEDLAKIADPLFSTKSKGLGLGLAITKAILDSHKAELKVDSEPGVGSEFQVLFPIRESA